MTWFTFLSNTTAVVQIAGNVIVMFYVFPAFQQTRKRGFLFLGLAFMIGTFDTLCSHTIGQYPMSPVGRLIYSTLWRFTYFLGIILETSGLVLLTQSYLRLVPPKLAAPPALDPPP